MEAHCHFNNYFFTLTYDEENEPWEVDEMDSFPLPAVSKRDVQLFIKRLRKRIDQLGLPKIRYVVVSEYGPKTFRPHYHGILFADFGRSWNIEDLFQRCWRQGRVDVGPLYGGGSAYCSKYLFKRQPDECDKFKPNFLLASRKPPLGVPFVTSNLHAYCIDNNSDRIRLPSGVEISLPRILRDKIFSTDELRQRLSSSKVESFNDNLAKKLRLNRFDEDFVIKAIDRIKAGNHGRWIALQNRINFISKNQKL